MISFAIMSLSTGTKESLERYLKDLLSLKILGCLLHLLIMQIGGSVSFPVSHNMFLSCLVFFVSIIFLKNLLKVCAIFASSIKSHFFLQEF